MICTAAELAKYLGAELEGDPSSAVSGVASPERARAEDLIYVDSPRNQTRVAASAARCVVAHPRVRIEGKTILGVNDPKLAFAKATAWLLKEPPLPGAVHPTAIVSASARLAADVWVGPYVVLEDDVAIGTGTVVEAFCFLGRGTRIGEGCRLHPRVTLYAGARLGDRVEVHAGVVVGGDGFGYVLPDRSLLLFGHTNNAAVVWVRPSGGFRARYTFGLKYDSFVVDAAIPLSGTEFVTARYSGSPNPSDRGLVISWLSLKTFP